MGKDPINAFSDLGLDLAVDPETGDKDRKFVTALARGLEVLRAFKPGEGFLGNQEIARRTGLPKPTVTRLTYTLTRLGYLSYSQRLERYSLGTGVLALGYATLSNFGVRQIARPLMQELADTVDASVSLGMRERLNMIYLEHARGNSALTLRLDVGSRIPVGSTAMGRAFLAALPDAERNYLMDHIKRHAAERWPTVRRGIERSLRYYEQHGYVKTVGTWERDVNAVGVALVQPENGEIYAFNCGGPSFSLPEERLDADLGPRLKNLAHNVQAGLSHLG